MRPEDTTPILITKISRYSCESSFRIFFDRFYPRLFELALYYTKNQAVAEEVVSDVFLKVWTNRKHLEEVRDVKAYLFVAIKRQSLNALRSTTSVSLFVHDLEHHTIIESRTPENILFSQEMLDAIGQSIQNLPEKCQLVYRLVKEEKLKYKAVADLLHISEKTVEMHVGNALKKIREDLKHFQREPHPAKPIIKSAFLGLLALLSFFL
ncbi:MAG: RNA polymerase sigma-70 factor [Cyclobacteriaceae bacterium]